MGQLAAVVAALDNTLLTVFHSADTLPEVADRTPTAANAMKAKSNEYSTRSCPSSPPMKRCKSEGSIALSSDDAGCAKRETNELTLMK
jgi:hypothetical protein